MKHLVSLKEEYSFDDVCPAICDCGASIEKVYNMLGVVLIDDCGDEKIIDKIKKLPGVYGCEPEGKMSI